MTASGGGQPVGAVAPDGAAAASSDTAAGSTGLLDFPWATTLKPYGTALLALARERPDVIALGADLTRQTETDLIRDELPDQFVNVGMAEQNLVGIAAGLARAGRCVFVHTFGVFATRRPFEQIALQVAYPRLDVKLVGFMPGLSSPGGPSHQAIDDVALMRALPNMTVLDVADATEVRQAVGLLAAHEGPCYLRLKRGEVPVLFDDRHHLELGQAQWLRLGDDVAILAAGMLVPTALRAAEALAGAGVAAAVVNVPTLEPIDRAAVLRAAAGTRAVVTAENHSIVGGLGSAVAEVLAEAGAGRPLRRVGIADTFAQASSAQWLFRHYGLDVGAVVGAAWTVLGRDGAPPAVEDVAVAQGQNSPV
ncbi:MAG: transketolase family protein [Acidimicrobiales bacterium]